MKAFYTSILILTAFSISAQDLKVTYIANEGVLLEGGGSKAIIDALFDDFYKDYLSPSEATVKQMMESSSPFDQVNLILTTHFHRDHFEANLTGNFLKNHRETRLLSSEQVKGELESKYVDYSQITSQIKAHKRGVQTLEDNINGLKVYSFFINHAGGERTAHIENMGFIIEISGKRVLHLGDADMNPERFKEVDLTKYNIDVALVPYWYMSSEEGMDIINNHIKAKHLIGIHYPKAPSASALEAIKENYPKATVFQKTLTEVQY
ncbi:MBL fold metallo-hydrolase [Roseivirga sp. E12]|uniref:MBL fold metallo-hydrolase n=1 Tax=Roseivirga sp. E12 TaxID=2819237 RepID=UPI001ABBEFEA|nr:MBL fold metallo-hydrolase [Roseivirga sp. E12]MBO3699811.1 MBL fold metallo-hydrolase [Roseivirga sp. E12]